MSNNQAGKGDKPRPVDKKQFDSNFDQISWNELKKSSAEVKKVKNKTKYTYK